MSRIEAIAALTSLLSIVGCSAARPSSGVGGDASTRLVADSSISDATCAPPQAEDIVDLCLRESELRAGGQAGVVVLDASVDLGTPVMPRCPGNEELDWKQTGGESCRYEPLCPPRLVLGSEFSCCYVTRETCAL